KRPLKEYSKGMTRRIGIAQALINDPEVVFLDEPTSGLDPNGRADMKAIITDLKERGKTVVVCSHLLAEIEDICDRVAILGNGELQLLGSVEDLLRSKNQTQITAETLPPEAISEIESVVARYSSNGVAVANPRRTLEEVFLATGRMSEARPGRRFVDGDNPLDVDAAAATEDGSADPAGH
ncbi:MAG: ABC transporter ATP-binding protein, partial [Planctomycetota bacterium]